MITLERLCMGCFAQLSDQSYGASGKPRPTDARCPVCGYMPPSDAEGQHRLAPRTVLSGKYMVGKPLGEGGFGITYLGYDLNLDIKVAIKEFYPFGFVTRSATMSTTVQPLAGEQGEFFLKGRERFVDEAKRLAKFRTFPGIVMVNDFFVENGTAYIVMEYVEGETLKSYMAQQGGRLPAEMVLAMMRPVFESLAQIHAEGLIHRDISPDNIMVTHGGEVKLLDFGAAREFGEDGNKSLSVMLKHGYAPPEQYTSRGVQGPHTDVYALCATIYKAVTGVTPDGSMDRLMEDRLVPPSVLGAQMPYHAEVALMHGLAVKAEHRWQTVGDLYAALYNVQLTIDNAQLGIKNEELRIGQNVQQGQYQQPVEGGVYGAPPSPSAPQYVGATVPGRPVAAQQADYTMPATAYQQQSQYQQPVGDAPPRVPPPLDAPPSQYGYPPPTSYAPQEQPVPPSTSYAPQPAYLCPDVHLLKLPPDENTALILRWHFPLGEEPVELPESAYSPYIPAGFYISEPNSACWILGNGYIRYGYINLVNKNIMTPEKLRQRFLENLEKDRNEGHPLYNDYYKMNDGIYTGESIFSWGGSMRDNPPKISVTYNPDSTITITYYRKDDGEITMNTTYYFYAESPDVDLSDFPPLPR